MQTIQENHQLDGQGVRQAGATRAKPESGPAKSAARSPTASPILLTDIQAAECLGISRRKFHELRDQAWLPKPIVLGPRIVRWSRSELEHAQANMPRQEQASEPAQLRRGRIEALKRGAR